MGVKSPTVVLCMIAATVVLAVADLQRFEHRPVKADGSVRFLAIGDWGRRGLYNQSIVAYQMDPRKNKAPAKKKFRPKVRADTQPPTEFVDDSVNVQNEQFRSFFSQPAYHPQMSQPDSQFPLFPAAQLNNLFHIANQYNNQPFQDPTRRHGKNHVEVPDEETVPLDDDAEPEPFDDAEYTDEETIPLDDDAEPATKKKGKVSRRQPNRAKPIPWNDTDEVYLTKAFFQISTDPIVGDQQKSEGFWKRVSKEYHRMQKLHTRKVDQLSTKWRKLQAKIKLFNAEHSQTLHQWPSGKSGEDLLKMTMARWKDENGTPFAHIPAWEEAAKHDKFQYVKPVGGDIGGVGDGSSGGSSKRARTTDSNPYESSGATPFVPDLNEDSNPTRPSRRSRLKEDGNKGKSKVDEVADELAKLRREEKEERKMRQDQALEARLQREGIAKQLLEVQLETQKGAKKRQDLKFYTEPHSHLEPFAQELVLEEKRAIAATYGWPMP